MNNNFLLYGANGYTALLIIDLCNQQGIRPTIGGRTLKNIKPLAEKHGLEYEVFSVDETQKMETVLSRFNVVLNCAGPFFRTYQPMVQACIKTQTHYLDITGEIDVFEGCKKLSKTAEKAGVMLMPGVGFDVVPTDCLAKALHNKMPDATHLKLAFASTEIGVSRGTKTTMIENLGSGGAIRENGKIKKVPNAYKVMKVPFMGKTLTCATIPWGDISTAHFSTAIPNIETYMGVNKQLIKSMKINNYLGWLFNMSWIKKRIIKKARSGKPGPDAAQRERAKVMVWGQVENAKGEQITGNLLTPEGYKLTALTALAATQKTLSGKLKVGFQTPSVVFGQDFIMEFEGVKREFS